MSVSLGASPWSALSLTGSEGELVCLRVSTDPRLLEDLLECLATVPFPVNPQIYHGLPTVVEFPAYARRISEVQQTLRAFGFDPASLEVSSMLQAISN